ncbi:FAD-binding oxidoreductase [Novosphingobium profundi]|uniref:FAD-binding oxidoreductase n=1 Tax=Novosphingobium profundi TaxID=1774954 RepID=UPI001BDACD23|nr:FAD-binding oxidoreductase [Novosphingobium profundi]MBT0670833.1 FAD-binding oxidoreductase [Novosphingobium profundi]
MHKVATDDRGAIGTFFKACEAALGMDRVQALAQDRMAYTDQMGFDATAHEPAGAVAPRSVEELRQVVRLANAHEVALWPVSRGKNFGYGGAAPVLAGSVVVDLSGLKRIHEIDVKRGFCVVEPGVGFYDLYDELARLGHPLWMSVPGNAWGSVAGNALERGKGPQPYGDHGAQICGLEVMLADGSLVRTGTGAMAGSKTWHLSRDTYGPAWDQMFCQSNFGIVTRLGLWLMPAPEATLSMDYALAEPGDLARGVDAIYPLRQRGLIDHDPAWVSYVGIASFVGPRRTWYEGEGLLPEEVGAQIRRQLGIGWWNAQLNFYGHEEVIRAKARVVADALEKALGPRPEPRLWRQGDDFGASHAGIPSTRDMMMIDWYGGRGGHLGFSPILPADGALAQAQFERTRARFEAAGIDYYGAFSVGGRAIISINEILYDRDDVAMAKSVPVLMNRLIEDAAREGYAEYRTHIDAMDRVAATLDYGAREGGPGAMARLNALLKDAIDPNGILAPGKQGIWPARYREGGSARVLRP